MRINATLLSAMLLVSVAGCSSSDSKSAPDDSLAPVVKPQTPESVSLSFVGRYSAGVFGQSAAEITAYDRDSQRGFVVNAQAGKLDVLDLSNPAEPKKIDELGVTDIAPNAVVNSVAVLDGLVAVAIESSPKTSPGFVALYNAADLTRLGSAQVGAQPDMVTFTPDGKYLLLANEGEPNDDYSIDPEGSVSVVDVAKLRAGEADAVRTADFRAFNGKEDELRAQGVRIYGPADNSADYADPANRASAARDLEPEYIAVAEDSRTAWVTLQENNALARLDVESATITAILPLGYKDHGQPGNALDVSDEDGVDGAAYVNIRKWPGVMGMYQPDAIAAYTVAGKTYLVTVNEGDARAWGEDTQAYWDGDASQGFVEEFRVKHLFHTSGFERRAGDDMPLQLRQLAAGALLDPTVFDYCGATASSPGNCRADLESLGRLNVTWTMGYKTNADGSPKLFHKDTGAEDPTLTASDPNSRLMYDALYAYGARSFSIFDEDGTLVWDSGDAFERFLAESAECKLGTSRAIDCALYFNSGHDEAGTLDSRSDAKGPEPEAVTLGRLGDKVFAFIGLERMGGVMVYDVTNPQAPKFMDYLNTRDNWADDPEAVEANWATAGQDFGDLGPEGIVFIPATDSPTGEPLLMVGNEVSGTTAIFRIDQSFAN